MKELPTGLQEFEHIRKTNALYVDKTDMIYSIASGARKQFFVSRPRRFGKTLMCWTLNALFSGKRELFEGLAISKTDWAWESYPIIHLDMSKVSTDDGSAGVRRTLISQTRLVAESRQIDISMEADPGSMLTRIIMEAAQKHGRPAVVIIDEYDKPFTDFYNKPLAAEEVRKILSSYYVQLKANEPHMRFLFMTGICKFTKAGVFSKLNNLNDLSLDKKFGTLFGYTQEELVGYFAEHLEATAKDQNIPIDELVEKMKGYYNGYCFDGIHKVYNPFSVLNFFQRHEFGNFWMRSGSTSLIAEYMKGRSLTVEQFRGMPVSYDFADDPGEIETAPPESFFYQTGYLTLRERIGDNFLLDYPNTEVLNSMSELVYKNMINHNGDFIDLRTPLLEALEDGDGELLVETLNRLLAGIPYNDYAEAAKQGVRRKKLKLTTQEWLYRSTILAFFRGCGVLAFGEMHGSQGRSDMLVVYNGAPWIIEIKVAGGSGGCRALAGEALAQINDRQYAGAYLNAKKLGIAIDDSARQIGEWVEAE